MDNYIIHLWLQRILGVVLLAMLVFLAVLDDGNITALIMIAPIILCLIFTKDVMWLNKYHYEDENEEL